MCNDALRLRRATPLFLAGLACWTIATVCSAAETQPAEVKIDPQVQALMDKHLRLDPTYSPGDLLTRYNVEPIYNEIIARGMKPSDDAESTYTAILRDEHPLALQLRSPEGRALMKKIGNKPLAYDRLERLSWLPGGHDWVKQLIASPDGAEMIERLFSDDGIAAMEKKFADHPSGRNFGLPTGRIYTEAALGAQLTAALRKQLLNDEKSAEPAKRDAKRTSSTKASSAGTTKRTPAGA
jgi:hypothetical protein